MAFKHIDLGLKIPYNASELIAQVKQKDSTAFASLYDKYSPALYTIILQILRQREASDKVLQKVFIDIWNKIGEYHSGKGSVFIWMLQIARNTALGEIKSLWYQALIQEKKESSLLADLEIDDFGLKKIINQWSENQKEIVNLYYYQGFSFEQIAASLSLSENFVKKTIKTALSEIKNLLVKK